MTPFQLAALFLTLVAAVGWLNARLLRLPPGVAMLAAGLIGALCLYGLKRLGLHGAGDAVRVIGKVDFPQTVVGYMLAFLLFAGAMQVDLSALRKRWVAVSSLATFGVLGSIGIVGFGLWAITQFIGVPLTLSWALAFGALISPTDPVAVLATVKYGNLSKSLKVILEGEALFNDGVGIVAFTALVALATGVGNAAPVHAVVEIVLQALGGLVFGAALSWLVIRAMGTLDDFMVEVAMTIALAMVSYAGAQALGLSGAIAVVGAGMLFGGERDSHG